MQSKTLTIVFADIQGFTSRTSRQTREENELFIREMKSFVVRRSEKYDGKVVKTMGDGFLITFESPTNAVNCGLEIQREIEKRNTNILDSENFVRFRIGISTGEVDVDEKEDVFGEAVNIAARIEKFAEPNGVFIAETTYLAMNKAEVHALDLGPQHFKNILREIRVYKVVEEMTDGGAAAAGGKKRFLLTAAAVVALLIIGGVLLYVTVPRREPEEPARVRHQARVERKHDAFPVQPLDDLWRDEWNREFEEVAFDMAVLDVVIHWPHEEGGRRRDLP